jgi:hypothetical protein
MDFKSYLNEGKITLVINAEKLLKDGFKKSGDTYSNGSATFIGKEVGEELKGRTTKRDDKAYMVQSNVEPVSILVMDKWVDIV